MTYKVNIKKDYKPEIRHVRSQAQRRGKRGHWLLASVLIALTGAVLLRMGGHDVEADVIQPSAEAEPATAVEVTVKQDSGEDSGFQYQTIAYINEDPAPGIDSLSTETVEISQTLPLPAKQEAAEDLPLELPIVEDKPAEDRHIIKSGDSLSLIFDKLHLGPQQVFKIISVGKPVAILKRLTPGNEMRISHKDGEVISLEYEIDLLNTLKVSLNDDKYVAETLKTTLDTTVSMRSGVISDSLFLSAQRAGLSDNLTMQLVHLYGWDIDFVLDIRDGDQFYVIYEEKFKDGVKVKEGPILAAEFVNRNTPFRAFRYTHTNGRTDYYNEKGYSMRKAFLRTPVNFSRISSGFSLKRRHPILNTFRSHKGVDYAAPTGTPIKTTGDGVITYSGYKGGYGRAVIIRHGSQYETLYGHMSRVARGMHPGKRVKQGQIIGYVGSSGLATGPHLHYEFRLNGVHRNPLTVKLPKAMSIPETEMPIFMASTQPLYAQLDVLTGRSSETSPDAPPVIALIEKSEEDQPEVE
ncbi:MAG: peptidoglycan DD-metalloendopeptidase family protein [Gammaproteobacteria bacterium]|nr:peptidoglycan DD-metalloendopeptidase family protein [Gammaproteobacteria bacterium]NIO61598.1 peptidoglycan DD-metalloendopeptidase family protein [Gammaproteobacteria bacterium]NIQ18849.1 peptidoglycan DD-metalloendopeptidase family protein [Gammaproteobacteria bacterium]NIT04898.1 peptidoglycan DD-metalloendopeptidase family protein [Gammaproteobacteria bacterium]NIT40271.1 peptidoglycan DD-metalloendopeptidase family protein [Gammaproteobacteria bacterium]